MAFATNYRIKTGNRKVTSFAAGSLEAVIEVYEINYKQARIEFLQFLSDLWVSTVRQAAFWSGGNHRPAPIETLYAERDPNSGRVLVGWDNYPSEARAPGSARIRFEHIAGVWAGRAMEYSVSFFSANTFVNGLRSDVARQRQALEDSNTVNIFSGQKGGRNRAEASGRVRFDTKRSV